MRIVTVGLILALGPAGLPAQGKPKPGPETKRPERTKQADKDRIIRRKILEQKARAKNPKLVRRNVKVRVRLRNGESLVGVVKEGRFIEKPQGLEFVPADIRTKGAGIRLWYYDNTDGYIFIPYTLIRTYKVIRTLTDVEIKEIRDRILAYRRRAAEEGKKRLEELARRKKEMAEEEKAAQKLEKLAKDIEAKKKREAEEKRLLALVKEFPPEEGWGPDKIEEIRIRKVALGVFPDARSKRFIQVYEDWKKGVALLEKKKAEEKAAKKEGGGAEPKPAGGKEPAKKEKGEAAGPGR